MPLHITLPFSLHPCSSSGDPLEESSLHARKKEARQRTTKNRFLIIALLPKGLCVNVHLTVMMDETKTDARYQKMKIIAINALQDIK